MPTMCIGRPPLKLVLPPGPSNVAEVGLLAGPMLSSTGGAFQGDVAASIRVGKSAFSSPAILAGGAAGRYKPGLSVAECSAAW